MRLRLTLPRASQFRSISSWSLTDLFAAAINLILVFAAVLFFFQLLFAGLSFILAGGDKEKTHTATQKILHAFIGLLVVFGTYALMGLVSSFLGIPLLQFTIISV